MKLHVFNTKNSGINSKIMATCRLTCSSSPFRLSEPQRRGGQRDRGAWFGWLIFQGVEPCRDDQPQDATAPFFAAAKNLREKRQLVQLKNTKRDTLNVSERVALASERESFTLTFSSFHDQKFVGIENIEN